MRKNRVGFFFFFFFFMSDLGEEFAKICIQWLKKALAWICVLTVFPHLETFFKILENSTLSRYVKKKNPDRPTQFSNFGRVITIFFFGLTKNYFWSYDQKHQNFLIIFFIFQHLQSQISQFDKNWLIGFANKLFIYILHVHVVCGISWRGRNIPYNIFSGTLKREL